MGRRFAGVLTALALALAAVPGLADPITVTAEGLRQTANLALSAGQPAPALEMAEALLQRDPGDWDALLIASRAARDMGKIDTAQSHAKAAWAAADTPGQRYAAALAMAQAQASDGNRLTAQFWLRHAIHTAPDDTARALAIRDFQYVRLRNPVTVDLRFSVAPSSNVNNGSSADYLLLYGIPFTLSPDAKALSGYEMMTGANLTRRIAQGALSSTEIGANLDAVKVTLSDTAKAEAPMAKGSDYDFFGIETFLRHRFATPDSARKHAATLTFGRNWYGGDPLSNSVRLDFETDWRLSRQLAVGLDLGAERQWRLDQADRSADVVTVAGTVDRAFAAGQLSLGAFLRETQSDSTQIDHTALGLSTSYTWARPVAGAEISAGLSAEMRDYALSPYSPEGREDTRISAGVSVFLKQAETMGFAPEISLRASRTDSNISLYDSHDVGLTVGLKSTF